MRFDPIMIFAPALLVVSCAASAPAGPALPFGVRPVADNVLATTVGTGAPGRRTPFRLSDELSTSSFQQTALVGSTIKDVWVMDVAAPLIAANVRATEPAR